MDHQGHGASEGDRCYVEHFSHYVLDQASFVAHVLDVHREYAGLPRFLFGHSLGGAISILLANATTASVAMENTPGLRLQPVNWTGVILSAPAIIPDPKLRSPLKVAVGKALARVLPKFQLDALPASGISTNVQVNNLYRTGAPHTRAMASAPRGRASSRPLCNLPQTRSFTTGVCAFGGVWKRSRH